LTTTTDLTNYIEDCFK